mgnify:CR=1 FL=1
MKDKEKNKKSIAEFLNFTVNCINEKSPIVFIILSHLKIEQVLRERLEKKLRINLKQINQRALERAIKNHQQLLDMCYATCILDEAYYKSLLKLNEIRNKVAHELDYKISTKEQDELINKLPKDRVEFSIPMNENLTEKEKEFRNCLIEIYSKISIPLYNKVKMPPSLLTGKVCEIEVDDMRYRQPSKTGIVN